MLLMVDSRVREHHFRKMEPVAGIVDLSDDGNAAVYNVGRPGAQRPEIWVHHFDTGQHQLVIMDGVNAKWIRGGNSIVYQKWRSNRERALMLREPNGTERQLSPWSATQ